MTGTPADTEQEALRLMTVLHKEVESHGLVLEEVSLRTAGTQQIIQVIVDLPTGTESVNLDQLGEVTTTVSTALDRDPVYANSAPYELEVSSPGLSRPLTEPRHWARALNRMVKFRLEDGARLRGRITEIGEEQVLIAVHHEPAKKGMKAKVDEPRGFAFTDIRKAVVDPEVNFDDAAVITDDIEDMED